MNAIIISAGRNPEGQTARAAAALREGFEAKSGHCHTVLLPKMNVERCRQCGDDGWGICRTPISRPRGRGSDLENSGF